MRPRFARAVLATVVVLFGLHLQAQNPNNPLEVALLRWYPGNLSALFTANLGSYPSALAFDGASMWITNE